MKPIAGLAGTLLTATSISFSLPAFAQEEDFFVRDKYVAVTERPQPAYDPVPMRAGAFELRPELHAEVSSRSNLFATAEDEVDDVVLIAAPSVSARSSWSRHALNVEANVRHREYLDVGSESNTNYGARVDGRIDASSKLNLVAAVRAARVNESRASAAAVLDALEPTEIDEAGLSLGANYESNRVRLSVEGSIDEFDYNDAELSDGEVFEQDFRDREDARLRARLSIAASRDAALFIEAEQIQRDFDSPADPALFNRDSEGTIVRVGANFELPVLLRGDVAIGHQSYEFDDERVTDFDGLSINANLQWFVTQLVTISGGASRSVEDPGLLNSAGVEVTSWGVKADYEARRNLLLFASANFGNFDFGNIDREDDRWTGSIGATYKLNNNVWVETSLSHTDQDSNIQDFKDTSISVALKLYP